MLREADRQANWGLRQLQEGRVRVRASRGGRPTDSGSSLGQSGGGTSLMLFRAATSGSTIQLSGELDLSTVGQLNEAIAPMVSAGGAITLDLSELEFMDSSALQAIYEAAKSLDGRGCLNIHGLNGSVWLRMLSEFAQISNLPNIHVIPGDVPVGSVVGCSVH
jgi:anti-anti-sigma factor